MIIACAVNFPTEAIGKKRPEERASTGFVTHDLRDTGAMLYQLSYEASLVGRASSAILFFFVPSYQRWAIELMVSMFLGIV